MIDSATPLPDDLLMFQESFRTALGTFHGMWASVDVTTDYAICRFLKVTPEEAHMITSGMVFGAKARLLASLMKRSDHPNKAKLIEAFGRVQGMNKRDVFAHGYMISSANSVTFLERPRGGSFRAVEHTFTLEEFVLHTQKVGSAAQDFWKALEGTNSDLRDFVEAAFSLNSKSPKSSAGPQSSA